MGQHPFIPHSLEPLAQTFGLAVDPGGQAVITGFSGDNLPVSPNAFCGNSTNGKTVSWPSSKRMDRDLSMPLLCVAILASAASVAVDSTGAAYVVGVNGYSQLFQPILLQPIQGYFQVARPRQHCPEVGYFGQLCNGLRSSAITCRWHR